MLELNIHASIGSFTLDFSAKLAHPWTVIFGPSGSGKTTLLRLISGLEARTVESVLFRGSPLTDRRPRQHRLGFVMQQASLFPHLTVFENLCYGIPQLNAREKSQRIDELLNLANATALIHRPIGALSGGERQRIALARALAPMPQLLLLDEPFSALDVTASDCLLESLSNWVAQHGIQCLLATHDVTCAFKLEAEVAKIDSKNQHGQLLRLGKPQHVLAEECRRITQRITFENSTLAKN